MERLIAMIAPIHLKTTINNNIKGKIRYEIIFSTTSDIANYTKNFVVVA